MGDGDAKTKGRFEPPPWEQEAFEALAARRAEEHAAVAALEASKVSPSAPIQEPDSWGEKPAEPTIMPFEDAASDAADEAREAVPSPAQPKVDDRVVEAMLIQLQGEERTDGRAAKRVGQVASAVTFVLGLGMLIVGLTMMRGGGGKQIAVIGSVVLSVFGLAFIGMASWVWITTNRSRGR
jgi:hypothetical protein